MALKIIFSILAYLLNIFDLIATNRLVNQYGIDIEANPIGKWLYAKKARMCIFKIVLPVLAFVLICAVDSVVSTIGVIVIFAAYLALAVYHVIIIKRIG